MKVWIASSSRTEDTHYLKLAKEVATVFAEKNYELLCGGNSSSMMKVIFEEFQRRNLPTTVVTMECYKEDLSQATEAYFVSSTFERTKKLYELADVLIFLPGGTGTVSEIFSSLEEYRTIEHLKHLIIYNYEGFYDSIINMMMELVQKGFNDGKIIKKLTLVRSINELIMKVSEENE